MSSGSGPKIEISREASWKSVRSRKENFYEAQPQISQFHVHLNDPSYAKRSRNCSNYDQSQTEDPTLAIITGKDENSLGPTEMPEAGTIPSAEVNQQVNPSKVQGYEFHSNKIGQIRNRGKRHSQKQQEGGDGILSSFTSTDGSINTLSDESNSEDLIEPDHVEIQQPSKVQKKSNISVQKEAKQRYVDSSNVPDAIRGSHWRSMDTSSRSEVATYEVPETSSRSNISTDDQDVQQFASEKGDMTEEGKSIDSQTSAYSYRSTTATTASNEQSLSEAKKSNKSEGPVAKVPTMSSPSNRIVFEESHSDGEDDTSWSQTTSGGSVIEDDYDEESLSDSSSTRSSIVANSPQIGHSSSSSSLENADEYSENGSNDNIAGGTSTETTLLSAFDVRARGDENSDVDSSPPRKQQSRSRFVRSDATRTKENTLRRYSVPQNKSWSFLCARVHAWWVVLLLLLLAALHTKMLLRTQELIQARRVRKWYEL